LPASIGAANRDGVVARACRLLPLVRNWARLPGGAREHEAARPISWQDFERISLPFPAAMAAACLVPGLVSRAIELSSGDFARLDRIGPAAARGLLPRQGKPCSSRPFSPTVYNPRYP
jgi:hypothetical protein